jgi:excisionase family DNA binding protein
MDNELLTMQELCAWVKVSRSTVDRWRKEGLPCIKTERLIRFEKDQIIEWLKNQGKQ